MDMDWGLVGDNEVTWSRRWMDAGCMDNAWMISYPRPRGVIMLVDCCVWTVLCGYGLGLGWWQRGDLVEEVDYGYLDWKVGGNGVTWLRMWVDG